MNVLLIGEFSSLHKYLKSGLKMLDNVDVILASNGDGVKKIGSEDVVLPSIHRYSIKDKLNFYWDWLKISRKFRGYDIVQIINPNMFPILIRLYIFSYILRHNEKVFIVAAGLDYALVKSYKYGAFEYNIFDEAKRLLRNYNLKTVYGLMNIISEKFIIKSSTKVIPSLYEYSIGYAVNKKSNTIPFPIDLNDLLYSENVVMNKIIFLHGLSDQEKKGTKFIKQAMLRLKKMYPDDVEIVIDGNMPFDQYVQVIKSANVIVDQCMTYGYGINACISMAQGKVVMSGARMETLQAFGIVSSPIINICPDADMIFKEMEYLVENRDLIPSLGLESRKYVETVHDLKKCTHMYVKVWKDS